LTYPLHYSSHPAQPRTACWGTPSCTPSCRTSQCQLAFIASVYLAGLIADATGAGGPLSAYASLADHFELLGYIVVAIFATSWLTAAAIWRYRGLAHKYGDRRTGARREGEPRHPAAATRTG
jgi:hypothetical protein